MNAQLDNNMPKKLFLIIFYFITMYIVANLLAIILYGSLLVSYPNNPNNENLAMTLTNLLCYAIMVFTFLFVLDNYFKDHFYHFKKKFFYYIGIAIAGWFFYLFLNVIINMIMEMTQFVQRDTQNQEAIVETLKYPLLSIPMIVIGAPIVEEVIFRGVIFNFAKNLKLPHKLNIVLAFILSSSLFGLIHVLTAYIISGDYTELILGIPYIAAGFALTLVYYLTNNIFVPIVMHGIQNGVSVFALLLLGLLPEEPPMKMVALIQYLFPYL